MALTYETITWTGEPRDDMQPNDAIEYAQKDYSYEFLGETRTQTIGVPKADFTVSGTFDAVACEAFIDELIESKLKIVSVEKWFRDPESGETISV